MTRRMGARSCVALYLTVCRHRFVRALAFAMTGTLIGVPGCNAGPDSTPEDSGGAGEGGEGETSSGGGARPGSLTGGASNSSGGARGGDLSIEIGGTAPTGGSAANGGASISGGSSSDGGAAGEPNLGGDGPTEAGGSGPSGGVLCNHGSFRAENGLCQEWSDCEAGTYVAGLPSLWNDRLCVPCGAGFFTSEANRANCFPSGCDVTEMTLQEGDGSRHAECAVRPGTSLEKNVPVPIAACSGSVVSVLLPGEVAFEVREYGSGARAPRMLNTPSRLLPLALATSEGGETFLAASGADILPFGETPLPASVRGFAPGGNELWASEWTPEAAEYRSVILSAGAMFAQGSTLAPFFPEIPVGFVQRLSTGGTVAWTHKFENPYGTWTYQVAIGTAGAVYASGFSGEEYFLAYLSPFDGTEQWRLSLPRQPSALAPFKDNGIMIASLGLAGQLQVAALDSTGDEVWIWTDEPQEFGLVNAKFLLPLGLA
jgi:hypothetical protein